MSRKTLFASTLVLVLLGALSGCNTVSGVGQDVQEGGRVLQDAAD
ncbi:entericidin A/B family lipoprotein [Vreelandella aquamarina]|nr:entericidin A/B family lipoprotein [Halomonas sp.]TVM05223.1 MAG: entericidin A/B family lipoprotein [Halomonas sp.]